MTRHKLEWVQALRGIAALMVVATHARYYLDGTPWQSFAERYVKAGAQGVDLFFLVSGFIMVYTTARADGSRRYPAGFLAKRFARIWPVYAVMNLVNLALQAAWGAHVSSVGDVATSLAFLPITTTSPPQLDLPIPVGWTLNFEFYFYLVFGLSLLAGRFRWLAFFGWMLATLVLLPLALTGSVSLHADHDYAIGIRYIDQNVNPIIWDFVAGVAIGLLYVSRLRIRSRGLSLALIVLAFAMACWWSFSGIATLHGMAQWGLPLALLFAALALAFKDREPHVPRALVWLGGVSYSLYLLHLFVFGAVDHLMDYLGLEAMTHSMAFVLLVIPLPLVYAGISRRYLEDGLGVWVRKKLVGLVRSRSSTMQRMDEATPAPPS